MSYQDIWLTQAQLADIDAENAEVAFSPHNIFGPNGYGVPRVLPPALPQPKRTWEELVAINAQIRRGYLKAKGWL